MEVDVRQPKEAWAVTPKVYLITSKTHFKIGVSKHPLKRVNELNTASAIKYQLHSTYLAGGVPVYELEAKLHKQFESYRANGEWFKLECLNNVTQVLNKLRGPFHSAYLSKGH